MSKPMPEGLNFLCNSLVSKKIKYHYWFTPKCACTTTKNLLWAAEAELGHCEPIDDPNYVHVRQGTSSSPWYVSPDEIAATWNTEGRYTFTFVRNPFARALSAYKSVTDTPSSHAYFKSLDWEKDRVPSFSEFLHLILQANPSTLDHHWRPLTHLLPFNQVRFDFIGCVERYGQDLNVIREQAIGQPVAMNSLQKNYYTGAGSQSLDDTAASLIRRIYADDFEHFRYSTDPTVREPLN